MTDFRSSSPPIPTIANKQTPQKPQGEKKLMYIPVFKKNKMVNLLVLSSNDKESYCVHRKRFEYSQHLFVKETCNEILYQMLFLQVLAMSSALDLSDSTVDGQDATAGF